MSFLIHLEKESFKFSSTHFTIFSKTEAERLHGHNYQVRVSVEVNALNKDLGMPFDFNIIKPKIQHICNDLDEFILIPEKSPFLKIESNQDQVLMGFHDKAYSFPKSDVRLLPIVNITVEELARLFFGKLKTECPIEVSKLQITIEETRGQSVTYWESLN